jgi:cytochrome P450
MGRVLCSWPILKRLLDAMVPADHNAKRQLHLDFSRERVDKRMATKTDRPSGRSFITRNSEIEGKRLAPTELYNNGALSMLAGTETTGKLLSGFTYILQRNPKKLAHVTKEVKDTFSYFDDMTMLNLSQLELLNTCVEEGLRMYPPLPVGLPQKLPEGGATTCD